MIIITINQTVDHKVNMKKKSKEHRNCVYELRRICPERAHGLQIEEHEQRGGLTLPILLMHVSVVDCRAPNDGTCHITREERRTSKMMRYSLGIDQSLLRDELLVQARGAGRVSGSSTSRRLWSRGVAADKKLWKGGGRRAGAALKL